MATSNDDTPDGNDGHPPKDLYYVHDENSITFINKDGDILARGTGDTAGYGSWSNKSVFEAYIRRDNKGKYSYIPLYPDIGMTLSPHKDMHRIPLMTLTFAQ